MLLNLEVILGVEVALTATFTAALAVAVTVAFIVALTAVLLLSSPLLSSCLNVRLLILPSLTIPSLSPVVRLTLFTRD